MAFKQRFGHEPTTLSEHRNTIEQGNVDGFYVAESGVVPGQYGLYAKIDFKKGDLLGTYHGEQCKISHLKQAFRSKAKYDEFCQKYQIITSLSRKQTCEEMEKIGYALTENTVLVMPRYPVSDYLDFYLRYNAMMIVNEPTDLECFWNEQSQLIQLCKVNVVSYTNYKWNTIDYIAATDILKHTELLVFYGNQYRRKDYQINRDGCGVSSVN